MGNNPITSFSKLSASERFETVSLYRALGGLAAQWSSTDWLKKRMDNCVLFSQWKRCGTPYVRNPNRNELHRVLWGSIEGSHNLLSADLNQFQPINNIFGFSKIEDHREGDKVTVYDHNTGKALYHFHLNFCRICFPLKGNTSQQIARIVGPCSWGA